MHDRILTRSILMTADSPSYSGEPIRRSHEESWSHDLSEKWRNIEELEDEMAKLWCIYMLACIEEANQSYSGRATWY